MENIILLKYISKCGDNVVITKRKKTYNHSKINHQAWMNGEVWVLSRARKAVFLDW